MKFAFWLGVTLVAVCSAVLWVDGLGGPRDQAMGTWAIRGISAAVLLRRVGYLCIAVAALLWAFSRRL